MTTHEDKTSISRLLLEQLSDEFDIAVAELKRPPEAAQKTAEELMASIREDARKNGDITIDDVRRFQYLMLYLVNADAIKSKMDDIIAEYKKLGDGEANYAPKPDGACCPVRNVFYCLVMYPLSSGIAKTFGAELQTPPRLFYVTETRREIMAHLTQIVRFNVMLVLFFFPYVSEAAQTVQPDTIMQYVEPLERLCISNKSIAASLSLEAKGAIQSLKKVLML